MSSEISAYEEIINNIKKDDSILNISNELKLKNKSSIKSSNEKSLCNAAVKYPTMKAAYNDIKLGKKVILLKTKQKSGNFKYVSYGQCNKTVQDSCENCHIHKQMLKNNVDEFKKFEKDIIPNGEIASMNHPYFDNMGKRGANKKKTDNMYSFTNEEAPIFDVLSNKNPKLATHLINFAIELLKNKDFLSPKNEEIKEDDEDKESVVEEENDNDENESVISENEDEEVNCITIYTMKNKPLYLNEDTMDIFEPEEDDNSEGTAIGILTTIAKKYSTIEYDNDFYTVLQKFNYGDNENGYRCSITNKAFDANKKFIGETKKIGGGIYELVKK